MIDIAAAVALKGSECMVGDGRGTPLGETAALRGRLDLRLDARVRRKHAAAQLSQDLPTAERILADELAANDPDRVMAAALTIAFVAAKSDPRLNSAATVHAIERLSSIAASARRPCPDCAYLEALKAWKDGRPDEALRLTSRAVALDERYFNALALRLILLAERLDGAAARDVPSCTATLTELSATLIGLARLNPCPLQAGHLDLLVSRRFERPDDRSAIWAMRLVLGVIARNDAVVAAALAALEQAQDLPPLCKGRLLQEARHLLTAAGQ